VLWTLAMLVVAIGVAIFASASLVDAQQRCFIEFPSVACPDGQDWRVGLLTFAFLGVPVVWVVGLVVAIAGRAVSKRRGERRW
jgi:ribose/xylose/arabinose/galactoside ABC-type transport system permease subunit